MKIAYVGIKGLPSRGGAERVAEAIVDRLAERHELAVYCSTHYTLPDAYVPGVRLIRIPAFRGKHLHAVSFFVISALHALIKGRYHLIHVHNAEACFVIPFLRLRYPVIATSHGLAYACDKWGRLGKKIIRLIDYFFLWCPNACTSVSAPVADKYERRYGRRVRYLPNGVDTNPPVDTEAAATTLRSYGVSGEYILFAAARLDPTKGCHLLLQALTDVDAHIPLVVVGDLGTLPHYGDELKRMADGRVTFIPPIKSKPELFGIVRTARLFIFPSTVEAMSMMLLETASLGVPIICSDIPENTSVLPDQALFFESGNVDDLAAKLRWALDHPREMHLIARAAKARVNENFLWDRIAERYEQLYSAVQRPPQRVPTTSLR